jgi:dihydropteroate synthase
MAAATRPCAIRPILPPDSMSETWLAADRVIALDRPLVFGVLNVTPDSFSDGGRFATLDAAIARATAMVDEGADGIDVGGESTRPQGAIPVDEAEELRRVLPVVRALVRRFPSLVVSVDTVKSGVARAAAAEGASVLNDVSGLRLDPTMGRVAAESGVGLVLMHSRGAVSDMATYAHAEYDGDVTGAVVGELAEALRRADDAGIDRARVVLDPGIGFAKRAEHSLAVLQELPRVLALGRPVMVGVSRKRFVGELTGVAVPDERVFGTMGANVAALSRGARLFRVHDVRAARHSLDVAWAVLGAPVLGAPVVASPAVGC